MLNCHPGVPSITSPSARSIVIGVETIKDADGKEISWPKTLPQQEADQLVSAVSALYIQHIISQPYEKREKILNKILDQYKEMLYPKQQKYVDKLSNIKSPAEKVGFARRLSERYYIFANEGSRETIKDQVIELSRINGLRKEIDEDKLEQQENEDNGGFKGFDRAPDSIGGYENIPRAVREFIGATTVPYIDEFGNNELSEGQPLVQGVNAGYVYNGLLQTLAGSTSDNQVIERLQAYRKSLNIDTVATINRLFNETGFSQDPDTKHWDVTHNQGLFQNFLNTFRRFATNPLFAEISPVQSKVYPANREDSSRTQFNQASQAFEEVYMPGLNNLNSKKDKAAYAKERLKKTFYPILEQVDSKKARGTEISDNDLQSFSQDISNKLKDSFGLSLHPSYIQYSIAVRKDEKARTKDQKQLVNAYRGVNPLSEDMINGISESLLAGDNIFTSGGEKVGGATSWLMKAFGGNAIFDQAVWSMSYRGADGKPRFGYQEGTYNMETVQKLNDNDFLSKLKSGEDTQGSHLLESEEFLAMAEQRLLKVENIDGLKQVYHTVIKNQLDENGENVSFVSQGLEVNSNTGAAFKDFTEREYHAFYLAAYGADGGKVQTGSGKDDYFYATPVSLGVIAESATGNMARLPVIHTIDRDRAGKSFLSPSFIDLVYDKVLQEIERIQRVKSEVDSLPTDKLKQDYHTNDQRGLKLYDTRGMLGKLADEIEQGENGLDKEGNRLEKPYEVPEGKVRLQLRNHFNQKINDYIDKLVSLGLIKKEGEDIKNRLLPDFYFKGFKSQERNDKLNLTDSFKHNIAQVYLSNYANSMGIRQLLYGDESKAFKGVIDRIRRMKGANGAGKPMGFSITSPELGIDHPLPYFHHVLIPESQYTKYSGEKGDKADAQMYMTPKALRYMLFGFGKLTKTQADILDKIEKGESVAEKMFIEAGGLKKWIEPFNSYKVVYFDGNTHLKCSAVVLTKETTSYKENGKWKPLPWAKDLHYLRESMESFEHGKDSIAFASPNSASKGMKYQPAPSVRNIPHEYFNQLNAGNMRLQQETPSNKLSMTDPTGLKFNLLTEQDEKGKEIGKQYLKDSALRIENNNYSIINSIFHRKDGEAIKPGDTIHPDDVNADLGKLYDQMRDLQQATGTDAQTLEFMSTVGGEPVYNMNMPATVLKFTQMYLSYTGKLLSEKTPGFTLSMVSDYGHQVMRQVHSLDDNGQPKTWTVITGSMFKSNPGEYGSYHEYSDAGNRAFNNLPDPHSHKVYVVDDLKHTYPKYDQDGNLIGYYSEMKRPAHFPEETQGKVLNVLSEGVGSRIPWDDKHQAIVSEVVDILPAWLGSIGIYPDKLLETSGSDFDGDKIYQDFKQTYPIGEGKRLAYGDAKTDKDKFEEYLLYQAENNPLIKNRIEEFQQDKEGIIATLTDNERQTVVRALKENKLPSTLDEFIKEGGDELNNGVLNNRIQSHKIALLASEHISGGGRGAIINQATDTSPIKNLTDPDNPNSLVALLREKGTDKDNPILKQLLGNSELDINSMDSAGELFDSAQEGKANIGAAIISVMTGGLLEQYNISGEPIEYGGKVYSSYGDVNNSDGKRKLAGTSALANTMTDNLKDGGTASKLGLTIEAVGIEGVMMMKSIPEADAVLHGLQPAAREYFAQMKVLDGKLKTAEERTKRKSNLLSDYIDQYTKKALEQNPGIEAAELLTTPIDRDALLQNIADGGKDAKIELAVLRNIQAAKADADVMSSMNKVMSLMKGYPATWEDVDKIDQALNKLGIVNEKGKYVPDEKYNGPIDVRHVFTQEHDIYSTYLKKLAQDKQLAKAVFIERTDLHDRMRDIAGANFSVLPQFKELFDKDLKQDLTSYLSIAALIHKRGLKADNGLIYWKDGAENIKDVVDSLRNDLKGKQQNFLVSKFLRIIVPGENRSDIYKLVSNSWARLSEHQQRKLSDSFTDLYNNPKTHDRAVTLFNYLLVVHGGQFRSGSFIKVLPPFAFKDWSDSIKDVNELLAAGDYNEKRGMSVFGKSYEQLINDLMTGYSTHVSNQFFVKSIIQPAVPVLTVDEEKKKVDWEKVKEHISKTGGKPVLIDTKNGTVNINLFRGIRPETGNYDSEGVRIIKPTGKFNDTEKALMGKNIAYIKAAGFSVEGSRIQFPYSIKNGNSLYVLKSVDKDSGDNAPTRLINKGENMPQGINAVYVKSDWKGSREQWAAASVFGQVPVPQLPSEPERVDNPPYSPNSPVQKEITQTVEPGKQPVPDSQKAPVQQAADNKVYTATDKNGNVVQYNDKGDIVSSPHKTPSLSELSEMSRMGADELSDMELEQLEKQSIDWKSEIDKIYKQKGTGTDKEKFMQMAREMYKSLQGKVSDEQILKKIKDCL